MPDTTNTTGSEQSKKPGTEQPGNHAGTNGPINQALKKEKQPTSPDDLSPIHNTHEIGTSGGDQRAPDVSPPAPEAEDDQPGKPVRPIPVEEPGDGAAPEIEYDEPSKEPPVHTDE